MDTGCRYKIVKLLVNMTILLSVSACEAGGSHWETKDISGLMPEIKFHLTESSLDRTVTQKEYQGRILMLYFGYTQCPDVCSTTILKLYNAVNTLGHDAQNVKILFVSVDPERDTLQVLRSYTRAFDHEVIGLRGDQDELRRLTKRYRVTYGYEKPDINGNYKVSHSSAVYVFDRHGKARLIIRASDKITAIHHDLARLVSEVTAG